MSDKSKIYDYIKRTINPYGKPFEGTAYELGLKIMDYIENMDDEKENGWIPVEKKLPEPGKDVAVLLKGFIPAIGRYEVIRDGIGAFVVPGQIETPVEFRLPVTAWTPLPEPYKED